MSSRILCLAYECQEHNKSDSNSETQQSLRTNGQLKDHNDQDLNMRIFITDIALVCISFRGTSIHSGIDFCIHISSVFMMPYFAAL